MSWNANKFRQWTNETVAEVQIDNRNVEALLSVPAKSMMSKSLDDVYDVVTRLAQYGIFITSQLNSARASGKYYEKEYKERLSLVLSTCKIDAKSREEREMLAVQRDEELHELYDKMKEYKLKAERLDGLPFVLGTYLSVVNEIFKLKIAEKKYGKRNERE
jgi:hypothetical protein